VNLPLKVMVYDAIFDITSTFMCRSTQDGQIDRLLGGADTYSSGSEVEEDGREPQTPDYSFQERAGIVEAFYGPDAETLNLLFLIHLLRTY
jgi:hypothetical protein